MLLRFQFSNFRSFRDSQELSLIASSLRGASDSAVTVPGIKETVLTACALYGANASGKTSVFGALEFMIFAVLDSHHGWAPNQPVPVEVSKGSPDSTPSEFVIDFVRDGTRHQYGFSTTRKRISEEWLFSYPSGRKQVWYKRQPDSPIAFGRTFSGENRVIEGLTRPNSLFLSAAAQNNHPILTPIYNWFYDSFRFIFGARTSLTSGTVTMCERDADRQRIAQFLSVADLGIVDIQHRPAPAERDKRPLPPGIRLASDSIRLVHKLDERLIPFELSEESDGTVAFVGLLGPIVGALQAGSILVVDELDSSLHTHVAAYIIRLFTQKATNPKGAQLVFNTHDTNLLGHGLLRRDQIWFAEKDREGGSHIYPLTDFKPREDENLQSGYLQGRYGAIPFISSEPLPADLVHDA